MIASAKKEIIICYYNFSKMDKPYYLLSLLKEASQRGVNVRIIVDHMSSKMPKAMYRFLLEKNIDIKYYNPVELKRVFRMDRRLHDKFIVTDNNFILIGGRNISNNYFNADLEAKGTYYDIDVLFSGKPAREATEYFNQRWTSKWVDGVKPAKRWTEEDEAEYEDIIKNAERYSKSIQRESNSRPEGIAFSYCTDATFVANHPTMMRRNRPIEKIYVEAIDSATSSVDLLNAYILLTPKVFSALNRAIERGVSVRLSGNSLKSTDFTMMFGEYLNQRRQLLKMGVEVYEFIHLQTMHAKLAVFDNKRVIVGSFNLDPRSAFRNSETVVTTDEPIAVQQIAQFFSNTLALSTKIDRKGRPEGHKKRYHDVPLSRKVETMFYRYTIAPILYNFL